MADLLGPVQNNREHPRVKTWLPGRYLLADGREAKCTVVDVSLGGIAVEAMDSGTIGERVVLYIDEIGRVEGKIIRRLEYGFAVRLGGTARVAEKIANRLHQLQGNGSLAHAPARAPTPAPHRVPPPPVDDRPVAVQPAPRGTFKAMESELVDLSLRGADVKMRGPRPPIGARVQIGPFEGRVVRHSDHGVAVEFVQESEDVELAPAATNRPAAK